jgi:2-keto-3-deoxy-L-rhamnonate aldolase RhmA
MLENRVKRIVREGGLALGTYTGTLASVGVVELIAQAGFDAAFIDLEHVALDFAQVQTLVLACERAAITPLVRTPGLDPGLMLRLLDMGVPAIQVPHIADAEAARRAVQAVSYPPLGERGLMATSRAARYGSIPLEEHLRRANEEVLLAVMIEDLAAVEQIEAIAATPGVDLVAIGPSDLSRALGLSGQPDHPRLIETIEHIARTVKASHNARLTLPLDHPAFPRSAAELRALGVGYTNCGPPPELRLLRSLSQQTARVREQLAAAGPAPTTGSGSAPRG